MQGDRAAFNQYTVDPTCKLCLAISETRQHFIEKCSACISERKVYTEKLRNNQALPNELKRDLQNLELFSQLILDVSFHVTGQDNLI